MKLLVEIQTYASAIIVCLSESLVTIGMVKFNVILPCYGLVALFWVFTHCRWDINKAGESKETYYKNKYWHFGSGTHFSGGSRIFPGGGGAPTPKSAIIFQFFAENCMKMKEFGPPRGGGRVPGAPPWIRQCIWRFLLTLSLGLPLKLMLGLNVITKNQCSPFEHERYRSVWIDH